jgi:hypothetical protein
VWHRADDLLLQAALLDEQRVMPVWEWLTEEYEAWVEAQPQGTTIAAVAPHEQQRVSGM